MDKLDWLIGYLVFVSRNRADTLVPYHFVRNTLADLSKDDDDKLDEIKILRPKFKPPVDGCWDIADYEFVIYRTKTQSDGKKIKSSQMTLKSYDLLDELLHDKKVGKRKAYVDCFMTPCQMHQSTESVSEELDFLTSILEGKCTCRQYMKYLIDTNNDDWNENFELYIRTVIHSIIMLFHNFRYLSNSYSELVRIRDDDMQNFYMNFILKSKDRAEMLGKCDLVITEAVCLYSITKATESGADYSVVAKQSEGEDGRIVNIQALKTGKFKDLVMTVMTVELNSKLYFGGFNLKIDDIVPILKYAQEVKVK